MISLSLRNPGFLAALKNPAIFCAIAYNSNVAATSRDGVNWTLQTLPSTRTWRNIRRGNGIFVALSSTNYYATSTDGVTWAERTFPNGVSGKAIAFGAGVFLVTNDDTVLMRSSDGINWTTTTMPVSGLGFSNRSIVFGENRFVLIGSSYGAISSDGINWSAPFARPSGTFYSCTVNASQILLAPSGTNGQLSTDNGANWSTVTFPANQYWYCIIPFGSGFSAVASAGYFGHSSNGVDWSPSSLPGYNWIDLCYADGILVSVPFNDRSYAKTNVAATSTDGVNWTQQTLPSTQNWMAVAGGI